jgi:hypothetical protein
MSEGRPHHPQEPAEGAEAAEGAPGAEQAGEDDGGRQEEDQERSVEHPQEPAEGTEEQASRRRALALVAYRSGPKYVAQLVEAPPQFHDAPLRRRGMQGMVAYARIAGVVLLGIAVVGAAGWDWGFAPVSYHAGAGRFFLLVGFSRLGTATVRQMVGGLGVLLALVNGAAVLVTWLLPIEYLHGPIEITGLVVGVASILAAGYLPDRRGLKRDRRAS